MDAPLPPSAYCSDLSLASDEPLIGSATQTDAYILIEYPNAWGEKALDESTIPQPVKAHLKAFGKAYPRVKTLLVRPAWPAQVSQRRCFVALAHERQPAIYTFPLADYESLLDLDLAGILSGDADGQDPYHAYRRNYPMFLVCSNGRRDVCCARHGVPVLNALLSLTQDFPEPLVWHSTHLGGHRFAANLLCLPHGLLYGRVRPELAAPILEAYRAEQIFLPNLRGRTTYPPLVQAAEHFLRTETGLTSLEALYLLETHALEPDHWTAEFFSEVSGETYRLDIHLISSDSERVFESCHLDKTTPMLRYRVSFI